MSSKNGALLSKINYSRQDNFCLAAIFADNVVNTVAKIRSFETPSNII